MPDTCPCYPVKADYSVNVNDAGECIIKTKGKFYNRSDERKNKSEKFKTEYYNMESLEKEMMDIIEKYHEKYEDRMDKIYHENIGHKLYSYIFVQQQEKRALKS